MNILISRFISLIIISILSLSMYSKHGDSVTNNIVDFYDDYFFQEREEENLIDKAYNYRVTVTIDYTLFYQYVNENEQFLTDITGIDNYNHYYGVLFDIVTFNTNPTFPVFLEESGVYDYPPYFHQDKVFVEYFYYDLFKDDIDFFIDFSSYPFIINVEFSLAPSTVNSLKPTYTTEEAPNKW